MAGAQTRGGTGASPSLLELTAGLPRPLLERALTHASWVQDRTDSYERLEFLGDSVLGLAIASHLHEALLTAEVGELAKLKSFVVSRGSCGEVARRLGVGRLILDYAPADEERRVELAESGTALGNVLEALIGAVYLQNGFHTTQAAVVQAFDEQITYGRSHYVDYKTVLQEKLATADLVPRYLLVDEEGPPHARVFSSEVVWDGETRGTGTGTTIKMSEQAAAREALAALGARSRSERGESREHR